MTFPTNTAAYVDTPWTDPNGIQWIYNSVKTRWARYRVASTGGGAELSNTTPQALGTAAAGVAATASRADHVHPLPTAWASIYFTGGVSGGTNIFADNVDGAYDVQLPNKSGTFAFLSDLGGTSNALVFGSGAEVVSMSLISSVATFTFGANSKAALWSAMAGDTKTQSVVDASPIGFAIRNDGSGGTPAMAAGAFTKVPMTDQATLWNSGGWNLTTGVFTAPVAGVYLFSGLITATLADQKRMISAVYKNGALYGLLGRGTCSAATTAINGFGGSMQVVAAANDTFELYYFQDDAAGTLLLSSAGYVHFSATLVKKL